MKIWVQIVLAVMIVLTGAGIFVGLKLTKPVAANKERPPVIPAVEVWEAQTSEHEVRIKSQGEVLPRRSTLLAAEVSGRVVSVALNFEVGESFEEGEVLLEIDRSDYESSESKAASELADAKLALEKEKALAEQALLDWKALGVGEEANDLVLRKPQMKSAQAKVVAAQEGLEKAARDLDRTKIRSPYRCQVKETLVELGSTLAVGAPAAAVFSADDLELRLPVSLDDYAFINVEPGTPVLFEGEFGGQRFNWKGKLIRAEGQVDRSSQSVFLVASVAPDVKGDKFLSPGLFLKAEIVGKRLKGVYELPRKALYGKNRVLIVNSDDTVAFKAVEVIRTEHEKVVIRGGLSVGDKVSISPIPNVIEGMKVMLMNSDINEARNIEADLFGEDKN